MLKHSLAALVFLVLLPLGPAAAQQDCNYCHLANGAWTCELMTVHIDFDKGAYTGIALGQPFNYTIKLLDENPDYLVMEVIGPDGPYKATVQFQPSGGLIIKEGGPLPLLLKPKTD